MPFTPRTSSTPQSLPPRKIKKLAPSRFAKPPSSPLSTPGGLGALAEEESGPPHVGDGGGESEGGDWDMEGEGWDEGVEQAVDAAVGAEVGQVGQVGEERERKEETKEPEVKV